MRPLFLLFSWVVAIFVYGIFLLSHLCLRIEFKNEEVLKDSRNYIYSLWHHNLIAYFIINIRYKQDYVWLNHPVWYMKPIHILLWFMGTKGLVLGSSGNSGRVALNKVVGYLKEGSNTVINPDGPSGPIKQLKSGVLDMSIDSGVPVIAVKISSTNSIVLSRTWDNKWIPLPFSKILIEFSNPIQVTTLNKENSRVKVVEGM